jgi:hypothetical protein
MWHFVAFYTIIFKISGEAAWHNLSKILALISPNVPAVYDVLDARIGKCVAFAGRTKCAGAMAWE